MNGRGKSDGSVVPANLRNKAAAAGVGEERGPARGNTASKTRPGRSAGPGVSRALAAVAGLDIALWDVLAKAAGLPLAVLLGGTLEPLPAYNSNGLGLIEPAAAGDEALELLAEGGFTALKVRVGRASAADDLAAVRKVRDAVGEEVTLFADYNQGLSLSEALERWLQAAALADVTCMPMSSHLYPEVSGHLLRVTPTRH
jgi:L-alanine-DL-glutamate epimerase-like enolase superfamily enzyme